MRNQTALNPAEQINVAVEVFEVSPHEFFDRIFLPRKNLVGYPTPYIEHRQRQSVTGSGASDQQHCKWHFLKIICRDRLGFS